MSFPKQFSIEIKTRQCQVFPAQGPPCAPRRKCPHSSALVCPASSASPERNTATSLLPAHCAQSALSRACTSGSSRSPRRSQTSTTSPLSLTCVAPASPFPSFSRTSMAGADAVYSSQYVDKVNRLEKDEYASFSVSEAIIHLPIVWEWMGKRIHPSSCFLSYRKSLLGGVHAPACGLKRKGLRPLPASPGSTCPFFVRLRARTGSGRFFMPLPPESPLRCNEIVAISQFC